MSKLLSVNFFAQPSAGKSSSAFTISGYLKNRGCNVELVREFAKDMIYSKREWELENQVHILGEQYKRMRDIARYGQVPMILTDCPILIGVMYSRNHHYCHELAALAKVLHGEFQNINVLVKRVKPYNPSGRYQTEAESDALAKEVQKLVPRFHYTINGDEKGQRTLAKELLKKYGHKIKIK